MSEREEENLEENFEEEEEEEGGERKNPRLLRGVKTAILLPNMIAWLVGHYTFAVGPLV